MNKNDIIATADGLTVQAKELERQAQILRSQGTLLYNNAAAKSVELTDSEVAVLIDSLAWMRDGLKREGMDAPNVEGALDKIKSLMTPATTGLRIEAMP